MKSEMSPNEKTLSDNMHKALGVQQAKHTPTPYHIEKFQNRYEIWQKDDGSTHSCVGSVAASADARFVVRACNCHDDLLAACKWAYAAICRRDGTESQYEVLAAPKTIEILQAAIAKAEGNL